MDKDEQEYWGRTFYRHPRNVKAERMERNARFFFVAGVVVLGVSLAYLLPVAEARAHEFLGAFIDAFWKSPFSPF